MNVPVKLHYRLWLEHDGEYVLGNGVFTLLQSIEEKGSLKKAAESLGIPYRGAWGRIRRAEEAMGVSLLDSPSDRQKGMKLSEEAKKILEAFRSLDSACKASLQEQVKKMEAAIFEIVEVGR